MKKVSFIVPIYNCEQYIKTCINSIKEINLENYEIILVNDGSTDNSAYICDELERTNKEIRCIHQNNQGVSVARNRGLKEAKGDNIVFLDADDSIDSGKMFELLKTIEENPEIDLAIYGLSFDYYYHGQCYRQDKLFYPETGKMSKERWLNVFNELYEVNALSPIWNKVFRKDILERNHLEFNQSMFLYEDLEFSLRYMAYCNTIYNFSECIYHYRQSEDEGNAGRRLKRIEHLPELINQIEEALNNLLVIQHVDTQQKKIKSILVNLYLVLAREKISVSNAKEVRNVCDDFVAWMEDRELEVSEQNQMFAKQILNGKVGRLLTKRYYTVFRHKIAVRIKTAKWYQKRKMNRV